MNSNTFAKFSRFDMRPIHAAVGQEVPEILNKDGEPTHLGRFRLVQTLANKFGQGFRNYPKANAALDHYDKELDYHVKYRKIRGAR